MTRDFSLLLKPVSLDCNMRCTYCFYLPRACFLGGHAHRMTAETLEQTIRRYGLSRSARLHFGWQGGEPTLAGLDFFQEAVRLQERHLGHARPVSNALQTNGILLDDTWGRFLATHKFLVGVSVDGPEALHDKNRRLTDGEGSHRLACRGIETLRRHGCSFNVLAVVSSTNQAYPEAIYEHLLSLGAVHQQYIECVEQDEAGRLRACSVDPMKWGEFLCRLFDRWFPADVSRVSIRLFDSIVSRLATGVPTCCPMNGDCRNYLVIEHDGCIYPCDFYVHPQMALGNVHADDFKTVRSRQAYADFGRRKHPQAAACMACRWLPLCMGDCCKNRAPGGASHLCQGWKLFYEHTITRFEALADWRRRNAAG